MQLILLQPVYNTMLLLFDSGLHFASSVNQSRYWNFFLGQKKFDLSSDWLLSKLGTKGRAGRAVSAAVSKLWVALLLLQSAEWVDLFNGGPLAQFSVTPAFVGFWEKCRRSLEQVLVQMWGIRSQLSWCTELRMKRYNITVLTVDFREPRKLNWKLQK